MKSSPVTAFVLHSALALTIAGCGTSYEPAGRIDVASNGLGVVSIEVERTTLGSDPVLYVHGIDASGAEIATLSLRTGTVLYTWDLDAEPQPAHGTELSISVDGAPAFKQVVPDLDPHRLVTTNTRAAEFAGLPQVARELAAEAQIVAPMTRSDEKAQDQYFWVEGCGSDMNYFRSGTAVSTCCAELQYDTDNGFTYRHFTQTTATKHSSRVANVYESACSTSSGQSGNCSGSSCYFGPCAVAGDIGDGGSNNGWYSTVISNTYCAFNNEGGTAGVDSLPSGGYCTYTNCCNDGNGAYPCNQQ